MRTALLLIALGACSKPSEPPPPPSTTSTTSTSTSTATSTAITDVVWDVPSAWQTVPNPSPMRKATYKIPKAAGDPEDAELSVSQVGGRVDENIERWAGQFGGDKRALTRTEDKVGPLKVTVVTLEGRYAGGGMPGAPAAPPKDGYALLAAIVEPIDPPYFFKMTGPKKTVNAARADFDRLVKSLRPK